MSWTSLNPIFDVLHSLLTLGVIGLSAFGLGRPLLRKLAISQDDPLAVGVWSLTLGLLMAGLILLPLAWAGWLYPLAIAAMSLAASLWAMVEITCIYSRRLQGQILTIPAQPEPPETIEYPRGVRATLALVGVVVAASLLVALAPPTAPVALSQSLETPKTILMNHGLSSSAMGATPQVNIVHLWFLWALALDGPVATGLVHWGLGLLLALATALLARPLLGAGTELFAGCLVLLSPGVQCQMAIPLEDLALALFTTLATVAVCQVLIYWESFHWGIAAGLMLGGAAAASRAGLLYSLAIGSLFFGAWLWQRQSRSELVLTIRALLWATVATAAPWFATTRIAIDREQPLPQTLSSVIAHLGPVLLIALLGLSFARRLRGLHLILGLMAGYGALALLANLPQRWWSPLVSLTSIVAVWVWRELERLPRPIHLAACGTWGILALAGTTGLCHSAAERIFVAIGWQDRDSFLLSHEPSYRAAAVINRILRPEDRVFCQDENTFYFACPTVSPRDLPIRPSEVPPSQGNQALIEWARASGCSYVLLARQMRFDSMAGVDATDATTASGPGMNASSEPGPFGQVLPILEYRFADDNNRSIRYSLLRLR